MKKKLVIGFCLAILLIMILVTNFLTKNISLVADSTCAFPCWNNIKLGETNKAELLKILANVSSIDHSSIFSQKQSNYKFDDVVFFSTGKDWTGYSYRNRAEAWLIRDKVVELGFSGDAGITLAHAIQKLGTPDHVYAFNQTENSAINVEVFFKEQGVVVGFSLNSLESEIVPDQNIDSLHLIDPNLYQQVLESGQFTNAGYNYEEPIPWSGYGKIKDKYWK